VIGEVRVYAGVFGGFFVGNFDVFQACDARKTPNPRQCDSQLSLCIFQLVPYSVKLEGGQSVGVELMFVQLLHHVEFVRQQRLAVRLSSILGLFLSCAVVLKLVGLQALRSHYQVGFVVHRFLQALDRFSQLTNLDALGRSWLGRAKKQGGLDQSRDLGCHRLMDSRQDVARDALG
jgi:hypothetical protein